MLRARHDPIEWRRMPHSVLSMNLRADVIENEMLLQLRLAYMQSYAAIHAHPHGKISDAFRELRTMYGDARAIVPYLTGGKDAQEQTQDENAALLQAYRNMCAQERPDADSNERGLRVTDARAKRK